MKTKVIFLTVILCMFASLRSMCVYAQEIPTKARYLRIIEMNDIAYCDKVNPSESRTFFKKFVGDTIVFKGTKNRNDFIKSDTIWIKRDVKKPVKGKHFKVTTHYKSTDGDKTTPNEYVYDRPWIIMSQGFSDNNSDYLVLKDLKTGDIVEWHYQDGEFGHFNQDIAAINLTKSRKATTDFDGIPLYKKNGQSFEKISFTNAIAYFSIGYGSLFYTTYLQSEDNSYKLPYGHSPKYDSLYHYDTLYTQHEKDNILTEIKNKGHYNLVLSNVVKPQNPQIRHGEMTTISNNNVTQYSYTDNYMNIFWWAGEAKFYFRLENKSGSSLKIEWDEGAFIDISNSPCRIFHSGVKYIDKDKSMPATVVPNGITIEDVILPSNFTSYSTLLKDWNSYPLIPHYNVYDPSIVGKTVKILFPISVKGVVNEYTFIFKINWEWSYPELRNEK